MILFVGVLKEMVSLTPKLFTMRFKMLKILCSLGRVFGKQKFLSERISFCGQLLVVRFLVWIILCLGVTPWQINVVCVNVMGNQWTTYFFTILLHTPYGFSCFRLSASIGSCQARWGFLILFASMAWESYFKYLEFDSKLIDEDCLVGTKSTLL